MQPFYWAQSGNPLWLKALMCLGIIAGLCIIVKTLLDMERSYKAQLREINTETRRK